VLSFLRREGGAYGEVTARAGRYTAEWTVQGLSGVKRRLIRMLPLPLRTRAALRLARTLIRTTYPGSRAIIRTRRGSAAIDLRGSLFCEVREASATPLCGFYAAAVAHVLHLLAVDGDVQVVECRASGGRRGCTMEISVRSRTEPAPGVPEHAS
jgi:hypothetical protein